MKIYSYENSSETHGMAWNNSVLHCNDTKSPQTQQEDAYTNISVVVGCLTFFHSLPRAEHRTVVTVSFMNSAVFSSKTDWGY